MALKLWNLNMVQNKVTEQYPYDDVFYVDLDEETDMFCVFAFDDRIPFAYSSWCDKEMAEEDATMRNLGRLCFHYVLQA